jgi:type II secretory pathway pseudopilin PulG
MIFIKLARPLLHPQTLKDLPEIHHRAEGNFSEKHHRLGRLRPPKRCREKGMTLVEVAIGAALLALVSATALGTLTVLNKNAVSTRIMGNAREIVERNIEAAVGAPFTSTSVPTILAITSGSGAVWDDDGGSDNKETIYASRDGTVKILGTLTRTVLAESNSASADIRRVTFHLDYSLYGRAMSYEMTTLRALDK